MRVRSVCNQCNQSGISEQVDCVSVHSVVACEFVVFVHSVVDCISAIAPAVQRE